MRLTPTTDAAAVLHLFLPLLDADTVIVLKHRYGLFGSIRRTLPETSTLTGWPVPRVYQLERHGLIRLRNLMVQ